jgi:hypothetical protein
MVAETMASIASTAMVAGVWFAFGYQFCKFINRNNKPDTVSPNDKPHIEHVYPTNVIDTADIYRIKSGPKKGLLSYKRARGE